MDVAVLTDMPGWRSILLANENAPKVKIQCKSAATVVGEIIQSNPNKNYVLKCDTEGSEFVIFDSLARTDLLAELNSIVMEYHRNPEPIIKLLEINGYRYYQTGTIHIGTIVAFRTEK